jgi:peptidoglycan/xylan/chitin deacetylase (PgdA/CDA1 family)
VPGPGDDALLLTGACGQPAAAGRSWLDADEQAIGRLRPTIGPCPRIVVGVGRAPDRHGVVPDPAELEVTVARALAAGRPVRWSPEQVPMTLAQLLAFQRRHGRGALAVLRAEPDLLPRLRIGSWWCTGWRTRAARRAVPGASSLLLALAPRTSRVPAAFALDLAFWSAARRTATRAEWHRLTRSSFVALCYHRLAGEMKPGQERMDVAPAAFAGQLRLLRLLRYRPLEPADVLAFHRNLAAVLPARSYVLTADDGFEDAVRLLGKAGALHPQAFVVTAHAGGRAPWLGNEPVAGWDSLRRAANHGVAIGSHCRHHVPLDTLADEDLAGELDGSLGRLREAFPHLLPVLAYPHGRHDARVRAAAIRSGYVSAYTTAQGRNGAGTDLWCLRRVEPKAWDTRLSFLWKLVTAQSPPRRWEQRLVRQGRRRREAEAATPSPSAAGGQAEGRRT